MQIKYSNDALLSLSRLVDYIEDKNTAGAGFRWLMRYESFLRKKLLNPQQISLCHNYSFKKLGLRCIYFNDWVIAFSVNEHRILIEALLHNSRIED